MSALGSVFGHLRRDGRTLLLGRPLDGGAGMESPPCFIVGSGRCGSTLLRAILMTSPRMHIPPETYVLGGVIDEYRLFNRLPWSFVVRQVLSRLEYQPNFDVFEVSLRDLYRELLRAPRSDRSLSFILNAFYMYHAAHHKPSAVRWGDKTPGNALCIDRLNDVFPDMRVVHMIRDGRDVVRSFSEMEGGMGVREATNQWLTSITRIRDFARRHPRRCLEVRYEDLVRAPESEIRRICDFIDLDFEDGMLRHHETKSTSMDIETYEHYRNVMKPITEESIGKWHESLDPETVSFLEGRMGRMLKELGYDSRDRALEGIGDPR